MAMVSMMRLLPSACGVKRYEVPAAVACLLDPLPWWCRQCGCLGPVCWQVCHRLTLGLRMRCTTGRVGPAQLGRCRGSGNRGPWALCPALDAGQAVGRGHPRGCAGVGLWPQAPMRRRPAAGSVKPGAGGGLLPLAPMGADGLLPSASEVRRGRRGLLPRCSERTDACPPRVA